MTRPRPLAASFAAALVGTLAVSALAAPAQAADDIYAPPATVSGDPGTVLKQAPSVYALDTLGTRAKATVTKIQYVSTGARGDRTAVTGTVIVPDAAWKKGGERPIIAVSPGTQGLNDKCAPSKLIETANLYDGNWIRKFYEAGYAVALTDYEGLGTPSTHPYANNVALGQNALDVVRAAQNLGFSKTAPVFLQGFSEGGGATAGALELAPTYAPELKIKGAHATAPTADLAAIGKNIESSIYQTFLLFAVKMLDVTYPELGIRDLVNDKGAALLDEADTAYGCLPESLPSGWLDTRKLTKEGKTISSYLTRPDIAAQLAELKLGQRKIGVPFKVTSSWADDVVPNASVKQAAKDWCGKGSAISYSTLWAPTHVASGYEGSGQAVGFFNDLVAGKAFTSNCGWLF
ncbi:lipase [Aeromicrobium flavum]|uniref:Lipase n=1 Tax=Aeromicrobium flavum TaxID=416568 RepID=A0A512HVS9_9ACTN|nr:lipase family protein [Aeromicrobium flavum]GEO89554.1 lipase [Aeromicrobium flavum]